MQIGAVHYLQTPSVLSREPNGRQKTILFLKQEADTTTTMSSKLLLVLLMLGLVAVAVTSAQEEEVSFIKY